MLRAVYNLREMGISIVAVVGYDWPKCQENIPSSPVDKIKAHSKIVWTIVTTNSKVVWEFMPMTGISAARKPPLRPVIHMPIVGPRVSSTLMPLLDIADSVTDS